MYEMAEKRVKRVDANNRKVIQRVIKTDCLNVVGENHLDDRRSEKNYLDFKYGTRYGYWTETTFPGLHGQYQLEGDPAYLRFLFLIETIFEKAEEVKKEVDENKSINTFAFDYLNQCCNPDRIEKQINTQGNSLNRYLKSSPGVARMLPNMLRALKYEMDEFLTIAWSYNRNKAAKRNINSNLGKLIAQCKEMKEQMNINASKDAYRMMRSKCMHEAANEEKTSRGVWKVGDRHREDMEEFRGREYNLISGEAFQWEVTHPFDPEKKQETQKGMKRFAPSVLNLH